jgi:hypothetical protein
MNKEELKTGSLPTVSIAFALEFMISINEWVIETVGAEVERCFNDV